MKRLTFLEEVFGITYVREHQENLLYNYSFLLKEKKSILDRIHTILMYEEDSILTLEDWHLDLLELQSAQVVFDNNNNVIEYPNYYNQEQLTIISILKKVAYTPDKITPEEFNILVKFFRNRKLVSDIIALSGNGLKLNKRALSTIMTIFERYIPTTGTNIKKYESLCNKLSLTKKDTYKLEKKIA